MKKFTDKFKWLALILLVLGCQHDDSAPFEEPVMESRMVVSAEDIPEVTSTLLAKMGLRDDAKLFSANTGGASNLEINWERVMQLVDSTGRKTYTFAIADDDDDPFSFYNLVMKYSVLGDAHEPFLMKYSMSEDFIPEYLSTGSLENFSGTVKKIPISQNSGNTGNYNSKAPAESRGVASGDNDSCPGTTVGSGGNNGGGDTPPDANNPPNAGGVSCQTYIVTNTWYSQACGGGTCEEPIVTGRNSSVVTICNREGDTGEAAGEGESDCDPDEGEIPILEPDTPPDCESFKYVKTTTDAYWQEAAVKGVYFEVYIIEPGTTRKKYVKITFNEPIWFGMPTKIFDGTTISPGKAANLSANILNVAMSRTAHYFRGVRSSRAVVRNYFQRTLKSLMPFGGKANFNFSGSSLVTPSQYQVRYLGTGNCE